MSKKPRNANVDYAVYLVVRALVCFVQMLPIRMALGYGHALAWLAYHVDKRHREVARENLRHAFPERCADPVVCDRLVRGSYRHFLTVLIEIACIPRRIHLHNWRTWIDVYQYEKVVVPILSDRPVLVITAHFGNWEVAGYVTGVVGLQTYAIARVLDNPYLHQYMMKFRERTGQTILSKTGDFEKIVAVLEAGGAIATLGDQDAGPKGLFVNFFNRPASTHKAVALLGLQYDAVMVVAGIPRIGSPMKHRWEIVDSIDPRDYAGKRGTAVKAITERFTKAIEEMVSRYPEQYFWMHRRWKSEPPAPKNRNQPAAIEESPIPPENLP